MTENVVTQNLRNFAVQIRPAESEVIVGTGMVVSADGKVVTCAHVVKSAGVEPRVLNGKELGVYFPQALGGEKKDRRAKVVAFFPDFDDDVVLLQLTDGSVPLGPERMPVLGTAEKSQGNGFRSYGYRRLEDYIAGWAHGTIQGHVDSPPKRKLQGEPVQLESDQINKGMSGSAVLDIVRNLVVGIVSETWFPDKTGKDSGTGWAVDSRVLSLAPLGLSVQDVSLELKPAPEPKTDDQTKQQVIEVAQVTVEQRTTEEKYSWNSAPSVLTEWTGRDHLLKQLTDDWNNPKKHVVGLIGFGGEGKSSLARKWVETLNLQHDNLPTGIFWWGFYENRSVDEFLEAALKYMSGGRIDPRAVPSSNLKAQIIGAMLGAGRYLFALDGLEVMQHQDGDQYGLLQSNDLRDLLTFFARPDNQSFCLITSRAPLLDLMDYTTYTHRDVDRLSQEDGRDLLKRLKVKGNDTELDKVVSEWDGHALTLSLVGSYLAQKFKGDVRHANKIRWGEKKWEKQAPEQYKHVSRILRRYDEHLNDAEKAFLLLFSAFRTPIHSSAFKSVFRKKTVASALNEPLTKLRKPQFDSLVRRLISYRIIRHDTESDTYTAHPLIRNYYLATLTKRTGKRGNVTRANVKLAHEQIKDYYLSIAGDTPQFPTLDDLKPLIEVVHHACQAGAYEEANRIRRERIYQDKRYVLLHQLNAYETVLTIFLEFFPNGDTSREPLLNDLNQKSMVFANIGYALMQLGRNADSIGFQERSNAIDLQKEDWQNASRGYCNLAELHASLGALDASTNSARQALELARRGKMKHEEMASLALIARVAHLHNDLETASDTFVQVEKLYRDNDKAQFSYSLSGIFHADHLRRTNQSDYARRVTEANLADWVKDNKWQVDECSCLRILGDLDADSENHESARIYYESALKIARGIQGRKVLIEALLARGGWQAKHMKDANAALNDLNEALGYCIESGYRIYEADVRVALGWAYLANGEKEKAKQSAERAMQMSNEMGYHWGKVDAEEVLGVIARSGEEGKPSLTAKPTTTRKQSKPVNKRRGNPK